MEQNKNILYWIVILPILAIILTATTLTYKFIAYEKENFKHKTEQLEIKYIKNIKTLIKNRVLRINHLIEDNISVSLNEEKNRIKELVDISYFNIENIYNKNRDLPKEEILKKIKDSLEDLRFFNKQSGYFFIVDFNNKIIMHPQKKDIINNIQNKLKNQNQDLLVPTLTNLAKKNKDGFITWQWMKPNTNEIIEKIGYVKAFEPLQIYIGTGRYKVDIYNKIKDRIKIVLGLLKYSPNEYIFTIDTKGTVLTHINKNILNKKFDELKEREKKVVKNILTSDVKNGAYIHYKYFDTQNKTFSNKISYVKELPSLNWIIGTGQYTDALYAQIKKQKLELKKELNKGIQTIMLISIFISLLLIIFMFLFTKKIKKKFEFYELEVSKKNRSLQQLNENLENRVEEQVLKIREKDELIHQQAKLAAMGEMIGNIAHQWRQPLSTICTAASGIKVQQEMNILDPKSMQEELDAIVNNTQLLSKTIEDFKNFFKRDTTKSEFYIKESINRILSLINASLNEKQIIVIKDIKEFKLFNLENELTQALLNIINNAKDALVLKNIKEKFIFINTYEDNENFHIIVKDNAGGIKEEILDKIFEPYFTTKFTSQGTGIGLYMTQIIIVNNMKGKIFVRNETFTYKNKEYKGAVFEIVLKK